MSHPHDPTYVRDLLKELGGVKEKLAAKHGTEQKQTLQQQPPDRKIA